MDINNECFDLFANADIKGSNERKSVTKEQQQTVKAACNVMDKSGEYKQNEIPQYDLFAAAKIG